MNPNKPEPNPKETPTTASSNVGGFYDKLPLPPQSTPIGQPARPITPKHPVVASQIPNTPLTATPIETPQPAAKKRLPWLHDIVGLGIFVAVVFVGAMLINTFIFRSFNVIGPSMEPTLEGGINGQASDRVIVNLLPVTTARLAGKDWVPDRGDIIVFKSPKWHTGQDEEYVVKRVVGLPGERVTVSDCVLKVYNEEQPGGFDPYPDFKNFADNDQEINTCVDGDGTDVTVPDDAIFVVGDHRVNNYSMDSRNGNNRVSLGTIALDEVVGLVSMRIWPLTHWKLF